jgi:hypothetical protein
MATNTNFGLSRPMPGFERPDDTATTPPGTTEADSRRPAC